MSAQIPSANRSRPRRIAVLLAAAAGLAAAIVLAVALLGGDEGVSLADAAANIEGESSRMRFDFEQTGSEQFSFNGTGVATADQSQGILEGTMTAEGTTMDATIRMTGEDAWIDFGKGGPKLPGGRRWIHAQDKSMAGSTMTPSQFVTFLKDAPDVENRGKEPVLGTRATHFHGEVEAEELAKRAEGGTAEQMAKALEGTGLKIPLDVWVTDDGLPKLMRANIDAGGSTLRMEVEVLEYGVPVDVEPPPGNTVVEESELGP